MKKALKKNQVVITALAIMIAVAGYMNFTSDKEVVDAVIEDSEDVSEDDSIISAAVTDSIEEENYAEVDEQTDANADENRDASGEDVAEASLDEDGEPIDSNTVGETVLTNASVTLSEAKLNREQTRSKSKEMLLEIINNTSLDEASKQEAINKMLKMTERMDLENAVETQLSAKGFKDSVVTITDESIDVILSISELSDQQRTQVENIVTRQIGCEVNDIVITTTNAKNDK